MPPPTATQKPGIVGAIGKAATAVKDAVVGDKKAGNGSAAAAPPTTGTGGGKPDQNKYNAEQEEYNKEIAGVKAKLVSCGTRCASYPAHLYWLSDYALAPAESALRRERHGRELWWEDDR
jgi:hypothetical protein